MFAGKHKKAFSSVLSVLEDQPREFEKFQMNQPPEFPFKHGRERYWFITGMLNDTKFTNGETNLDGWSSVGDVRRARGEELIADDFETREFI